jgi:hypothetical protein
VEAELEELNCLDVDLDTPIFRITAAEYLLKDQQEGRLTLTRIDRAQWFDPTENGLLVAEYKTEQGEALSLAELTRNMFGSCWSLRRLGKDEDWEAFAHERPGIRIESTPRRLLGGLKSGTCDLLAALKFWVGKINYLSDDDRHAFFDDPDWTRHLDTSNRRLIETVLRVRSHWKDESEVRLVVDRLKDDIDDYSSVLVPPEAGAPRTAIRFDWTDVVTGLYAGPTLKEADHEALLQIFPLPEPDDEQ